MSKNVEEVIQRYFSLYLGRDMTTVRIGEIVVVPSDRRSEAEIGWATADVVWIHVFDGRCIVSVRPDLANVLSKLLKECNTLENLLLQEWRVRISQALGVRCIAGIVYILYCTSEFIRLFDCDGLRKLELTDIDAFVKMKLSMYPDCDPECLAKDVHRNIQDGVAFGVFQNGFLVCAAEAPIVAHMQDEVEEIGVDTLPEYRGCGYGKAVVSNATQRSLELGRVPIYRCSAHNEPSVYLAKAIGYRKHADKIGYKIEE